MCIQNNNIISCYRSQSASTFDKVDGEDDDNDDADDTDGPRWHALTCADIISLHIPRVILPD